MDAWDRRGVDHLTIQEAARALGISEGAVRKRVTRGTLRHEKEQDGRIYVYLDVRDRRGVDAGQDTGVDPNNKPLMSQLRDEVAYLRDENRRKDEIIMQQAMTMRQLTAASSQEPSEAAETVEETSDRAESHSAAGEAQEGTELPHQRSGWLAPVDKLSWWHYLLGLSLVFGATYTALSVGPRLIASLGGPSGRNVAIVLAIMFALAWGVPGVFGWWVGSRRRNPRLVSQVMPFGLLVGVVAVSGFLFYFYVYPGSLRGTFFTDLEDNWVLIWVLFPEWLTYVSGVLIGNAWRRRRTGRLSGTTPASHVPRTANGAAQQSRKGLTPTQQAVLGWGGAIISALITLVGTIMLGK